MFREKLRIPERSLCPILIQKERRAKMSKDKIFKTMDGNEAAAYAS